MDPRLLFSNFFQEWLLEYKSLIVSPGTVTRNFNDYKKFIQGTEIDKMQIDEIKRIDLLRFFNSIINEHHLTRKSLGNVKSIFTQIFQYALDCEIINKDPMYNLKINNVNILPPVPKSAKTEVFNSQELEQLLEYIYEHYKESRPLQSLAILLNFQLGLRVGELAVLKFEDVTQDNQIFIHRMERTYKQLSIQDGEMKKSPIVYEIVDSAKCHSNRFVDLSDEALALLDKIKELHEELKIKSVFLFPDPAEPGKPMHSQRINDALRFHCRNLEIKSKSSHKIRKTVISNLFRNGFDLEEVAQVAGHKDANTTLKHYLFSMQLSSDRRDRMGKALESNHFKQKKSEE